LQQPDFVTVADFGNLALAYRKAAKGKKKRDDIARFSMHWESNLLSLRNNLLDGSFQPGGYKIFTVHEKKTRTIMAAPFIDRIVHHAVCNVVSPVLERSMVPNTCANRPGKGTKAGLELYSRFSLRYRYVLKCDIRQYFPSIDRDILFASLGVKVHDPRLLRLIADILNVAPLTEAECDWFPGDTLLTPLERRRGLPIGNMTSQVWANWYLNGLDHYVMDYCGFGAYIRYVDDFVIFSDCKKSLNALKQDITRYLERLRLRIHPEKSRVYRTCDGVPFLGFRNFRGFRTLLKGNIRRFKRRIRRKIKEVNDGVLPMGSLNSSIAGWCGHARMGDTWLLRDSLQRRMLQWRGPGEALPRAAWGLVEQQQRQPVRRVPEQQQPEQQEQQQRVSLCSAVP
jgi:retron-type reverse transcriptase